MAITSLLDITPTLKDSVSSITDKFNDEVIPKIEKISGTVNEINWTFNDQIKPTVNDNKNKINEIDTLIKEEILPITTDFIELYEVIIIRILLSKFVMFLNHIFKWYSYLIIEIDDDSNEITHIISLSETNTKNIYNTRYKIFKNKLKELKKEYNISYNDLVNITILYTKSILRK